MNSDEIHMIQGLRAGRESTYAQLFETYYSLLSVFALRYVNDLETAKEIVQDLFVHIYEQRNSLLISTSLKSYLFQSVRNRCLNHLKQKKTREIHLDQLRSEAGDGDDPEALYNETELEYRIFQIVSDLPARCKQVFWMSRVEGTKNSDIAASLNISIRTVETQISKALKILRRKLD